MFLLVLQEEGYTAVNYSSAEECLADLGVTTSRTGPPPIDVLLIDWHLSGSTTGLGVIRRIRQIPHLDTLPIILTTAALVNAAEMEELRQLCVALLEKPFSVDEVSQLIKQVTSTRDVI